MLHRRLSLVVVVAAVAGACAPPPPTPLTLPAGLALDQLSPAQRQLLRATLEVDGSALAESDVVLDPEQLTLSGDLALDNVAGGGTRTATLRVYGRNDEDAGEVVLGVAVDTVDIAENGAAFIDFAGVTFDDCGADVAGACALRFDENRNGTKNIDDLIAGVDAAPQPTFLLTSPDTLQFPSGIRTGSFARQVVVVENSGEHPVRLTRVQVAGGQGVGVSTFDPDAPVVDTPRRILDEAALDNDGDGVSDFVVQPGDEAFVAVSFAPVNGFLTTAALQIAAVDVVTAVPQAARTKVIANADGALRPKSADYVEPGVVAVELGAGDVVAKAFPANQLFSGTEISSFDGEDSPGLARTGGALVKGDVAMAADAAFVVDVEAGARFAAALAGLESDVDIALVTVDESGAVGDVLQTSRQAGTSAEAVEMVNTGDSAARVAVVLGRVELEAPAALQGALSVDERAPFRLTCQQTKGPELDDVDPVVPARGALGGGVPVVLHGRGFFVPDNEAAGPHVRVSFNGQAALGVPSITTAEDGGQTIRVLLPPGAAGAADTPTTVVVENPATGAGENADGQAATLPDGFRYDLPTPRAVSVTPDTATVDGGAIDVVVSGAFFFDTYGAPVVEFDGVAADAVLVDAATLIVTPPPHDAGLATIVVKNVVNGGETGEPSNVLPFFYVVPTLPAPSVSAIDVDEGSADGGATVVVSGANFADGARVFFGSAEAVVVDVTATAVTVTTPRVAAAGVVDVLVQNSDGQVARLAQAFTYILPPPSVASVFPGRAIVAGGAVVVVTGAGFRADSGVTFVSGATEVAAAAVAVGNANTLIVTTPPFPAAGAATLIVENADGQTAAIDFEFFEPQGPPPRIVAVDPASGDVDGGDHVVILGSDFVDPSVIFGSTVIDGLVVEPAANGLQQLQLTSPPGAAGAALVTVVNGDGQADSGSFVYVDLGEPRVIAVSPSVVHALIPGDELLVFGERLSLLGAVTAVAVSGQQRVPLAVTAFGDTLARLGITQALPAGRFTVELRGSSVVSSPSVEARSPNVVRVEVGASLLMIGDNLAGDRLTGVVVAGEPCVNVVADERLLTCVLQNEATGDQTIELSYGATVVVDNTFLVSKVDDGNGGNDGDPRCDGVDVAVSCTDGGGSLNCDAGRSVSWVEAHCACNAQGGELAVIHTDAENSEASERGGGSWIGLADEDADGSYDVWVDGSAVDFNKIVGQPAAGGCATISQGQWNVRGCDAVDAPPKFFCQLPGGAVAPGLDGQDAPVVWPNDVTINGTNLGDVQSLQLTWLIGPTTPMSLPTIAPTSNKLRLSTRELAPGPWQACSGIKCTQIFVQPPGNEVEGNDSDVEATGVFVGAAPVNASGNDGSRIDVYFFRGGQGAVRITIDAFTKGCGTVSARLDDGPAAFDVGCDPIVIDAFFSDGDEHFVTLDAGAEVGPFNYVLRVEPVGVVGGCNNDGIIDTGEQCDGFDATCGNCVETGEPDDATVNAVPLEPVGTVSVRRAIAIGDLDTYRLSPFTGTVTLFRTDGGPCFDAALDEVDGEGTIIGTALGVEGDCGTFDIVNPQTRFFRVGARGPVAFRYQLFVVSDAAADCGDLVVGGGEGCDDGNFANGDGCDNKCAVEPGFSCTGPGPCFRDDTPFVLSGINGNVVSRGPGQSLTVDGGSPPLILREVPDVDGVPGHVNLVDENGFFVQSNGGDVFLNATVATTFNRLPALNGQNAVSYSFLPEEQFGSFLFSADPGLLITGNTNPSFADRASWNRIPTCGNGGVDANEDCDGGVGCGATCRELPGFICNSAGCLPASCQSIALDSLSVDNFETNGGVFDGTWTPQSRLNLMRSFNLFAPVRVTVDANFPSGGEIAFVGVRSDGVAVEPAADEPQRSIYLRMHIGIGVNQADLNGGDALLESHTMPGGGALNHPYRVVMTDDGNTVDASIVDTVTGARERYSIATGFQPVVGENRVVLSGTTVNYGGLELCQGLPPP